MLNLCSALSFHQKLCDLLVQSVIFSLDLFIRFLQFSVVLYFVFDFLELTLHECHIASRFGLFLCQQLLQSLNFFGIFHQLILENLSRILRGPPHLINYVGYILLQSQLLYGVSVGIIRGVSRLLAR